MPGPFRIKMPLSLAGENLDENRGEFGFRNGVELAVLDRVAQLCRTDSAIGERLAEKGLAPDVLDPLLEELKGERSLTALTTGQWSVPTRTGRRNPTLKPFTGKKERKKGGGNGELALSDAHAGEQTTYTTGSPAPLGSV